MLIASYKKETNKNKKSTHYNPKRKFISIPLIICALSFVCLIVYYIVSDNNAINASDDLAKMSETCKETYKDASDAEYLTKLCAEVELNKVESHYLNEKYMYRNLAVTVFATTAILVILSIIAFDNKEKPNE